MENSHRNYAKELSALLLQLPKTPKPRLLLHTCCAPCSSGVLEYLSPHFQLGLLFYNPNIAPREEFELRRDELTRLVREMGLTDVTFHEISYEGERFAKMAVGLEAEPEGGARCLACFRLRLEEAAKAAKAARYEYFTTTLSISPLKNARILNEIGEEVGREYGVLHLPSDFKKQDGYRRSVMLSEKYQLYRQEYCGCVFSKAAALSRKERKENHGSIT